MTPRSIEQRRLGTATRARPAVGECYVCRRPLQVQDVAAHDSGRIYCQRCTDALDVARGSGRPGAA